MKHNYPAVEIVDTSDNIFMLIISRRYVFHGAGAAAKKATFVSVYQDNTILPLLVGME